MNSRLKTMHDADEKHALGQGHRHEDEDSKGVRGVTLLNCTMMA